MKWEWIWKRIVWPGAAGLFACGICILLLGLRTTHTANSPHPPPIVTTPTIPPAPALPLGGVVVIIDPGHGGQDPGADQGPVSEAALTYRTATEVAADLNSAGAKVVYTVRSHMLSPALAIEEPPLERPTDASLVSTGDPLRSRNSPRPLWDRASIARTVWEERVKWDHQARWNVFFLSLHYDQFPEADVSGTMVCIDRRDHRTPEVALALTQAMASVRCQRRCDYRGVHGLSGHALGVLDPLYNPVPEKVLLEVTTLSNPEDRLQSVDPLWRAEIARRITEAIIEVHRTKTSWFTNANIVKPS